MNDEVVDQLGEGEGVNFEVEVGLKDDVKLRLELCESEVEMVGRPEFVLVMDAERESEGVDEVVRDAVAVDVKLLD